jgi:hypothetical protein
MDCRDKPGNDRERTGGAGIRTRLLTNRQAPINPVEPYCDTTPSGAVSISKAAAISALV